MQQTLTQNHQIFRTAWCSAARSHIRLVIRITDQHSQTIDWLWGKVLLVFPATSGHWFARSVFRAERPQRRLEGSISSKSAQWSLRRQKHCHDQTSCKAGPENIRRENFGAWHRDHYRNRSCKLPLDDYNQWQRQILESTGGTDGSGGGSTANSETSS